MGWLEAVVTVMTSLAWPAVVLVAVLMLRKELAGLFRRMSRVVAPGVEAEFAAEVEATSQLANETLPDPPSKLPEQPTLAELQSEAKRHPVGAIVRAWNLIEGVSPKRFKTPATWGDLEKGRLTWDTVSIYQRLSELRNKVVHGRVIPSVAEAEDFVSAAWRLAASVSEAKGQSTEQPDDNSS